MFLGCFWGDGAPSLPIVQPLADPARWPCFAGWPVELLLLLFGHRSEWLFEPKHSKTKKETKHPHSPSYPLVHDGALHCISTIEICLQSEWSVNRSWWVSEVRLWLNQKWKTPAPKTKKEKRKKNSQTCSAPINWNIELHVNALLRPLMESVIKTKHCKTATSFIPDGCWIWSKLLAFWVKRKDDDDVYLQYISIEMCFGGLRLFLHPAQSMVVIYRDEWDM